MQKTSIQKNQHLTHMIPFIKNTVNTIFVVLLLLFYTGDKFCAYCQTFSNQQALLSDRLFAQQQVLMFKVQAEEVLSSLATWYGAHTTNLDDVVARVIDFFELPHMCVIQGFVYRLCGKVIKNLSKIPPDKAKQDKFMPSITDALHQLVAMHQVKQDSYFFSKIINMVRFSRYGIICFFGSSTLVIIFFFDTFVACFLWDE